MGPLGATCTYSLQPDRKRDISKQEWDEKRFGLMCTSSETFQNTKAAIESLCSISQRCTFDQKAQIEAFFAQVESIQAEAQALKTKSTTPKKKRLTNKH